MKTEMTGEGDRNKVKLREIMKRKMDKGLKK